MIAKLIRWSIANRFVVLVMTAILVAWGLWAVHRTPLDALPDLSDTQVIIRTQYPGQAPQIVEDQVTYPLATTMMSVPGAKTVRGYSFFGDSFVYVLFEDGTDLYWARSRVLEYLNQVQGRLPRGASAALGPDATGVGWIFEYALVDRTGQHDLGQLRALQDWFLKYELKSIPDVAEVASIGGMVRQYQIVLDPERLRSYNIPHTRVVEAIRKANQETGGSVVEMAEAEYMVRARGYLTSVADFRSIPLVTSDAGVVVRLGDVATIQIGPETRRGIAELDGEGEVAGGVVVMRSGRNALSTIEAVKAKLEQLKPGLPPGVEIVTTYDRSQLIERAVRNLRDRLVEEFIVVALVCALFLLHLRSAFVAVVALPVGILTAFIVMYYQGVNANIMSLGGIAIAVGAMVDAAVVMIENAHKHLEAFRHEHPERSAYDGEALEHHRRCRGRGGPGAVLLAAGHHAVVRSGVRAGSAGRAAVLAAGLYQDLRDGRGGRRVGDAGPGADGIPHPRAHPRRVAQSAEPGADRGVPAGTAMGAALPDDDDRRGARRHRQHGAAAFPARRRVHPAAGRRRPAVHAVGAAGNLDRQGGRAPADHGPPDSYRARGRDACSARQGARRPPPIPRHSKCSRPRSSSSRAISGVPA